MAGLTDSIGTTSRRGFLQTLKGMVFGNQSVQAAAASFRKSSQVMQEAPSTEKVNLSGLQADKNKCKERIETLKGKLRNCTGCDIQTLDKLNTISFNVIDGAFKDGKLIYNNRQGDRFCMRRQGVRIDDGKVAKEGALYFYDIYFDKEKQKYQVSQEHLHPMYLFKEKPDPRPIDDSDLRTILEDYVNVKADLHKIEQQIQDIQHTE